MILWNMLFPNRCLGCNNVIDIDKPFCDKCSSFFSIEPEIQIIPNGCLCISAFDHSRKYREYMLDFKFYNKKYYYKNYAAVINIIVKQAWGDIKFDYYTSVPAHRDKIKKRGYHQTKLIALNSADLNHCKYKPLLIQTKMNKSQHTLSAVERKQNTENVYAFSDKCNITGKTILLIDDVVTTGSTLSACADILLANGAKAVYCATINR